MWLNLIILSAASLAVGFVLGWIAACPRRWDARFTEDDTVPGDLPPPLRRLPGRV
ncbi:hypothetical protein [Actinomadura macrotermitis]|uniref:Uncharacterized protein n=1 Tax=Actinomadura macrotermitis TaxID=2585200 RepID=A0A7K0BNK8_9ACTN|nr:hypothetical protein [Actinomadura macrotermitis]MQY02294.1 hypothetical protein [Actinomadura macrotermitis]